MTADHWTLIALLAASTLVLRVVGYVAGAAMLQSRFWQRVLDVFPGCLLTALIASALARGTPVDWIAAAVAVTVAITTRSILLTMIAGMATVLAAGTLL